MASSLTSLCSVVSLSNETVAADCLPWHWLLKNGASKGYKLECNTEFLTST
ncbi:hypothetical protein [Vibrio mediterranei]|uniref:hypothetical protein n=1 Tax=Vibrio mediterranei TaxID=689 RepID=UPI001374768C|nr:hypothetical protein [Vibrio mediterranei]